MSNTVLDNYLPYCTIRTAPTFNRHTPCFNPNRTLIKSTATMVMTSQGLGGWIARSPTAYRWPKVSASMLYQPRQAIRPKGATKGAAPQRIRVYEALGLLTRHRVLALLRLQPGIRICRPFDSRQLSDPGDTASDSCLYTEGNETRT